MKQLITLINTLNDKVGQGIAWLTLGMVMVTFIVVVLRYVFNFGSIALQESVIYMHALVFMLGAAYTLRQDGHVRVDIFYRHMSLRKKAIVDLFGNLFFLIPVCMFIVYSSWEYVSESWNLKEGSREAGGLPWIYLLKTAIPIMAILLILQGVGNILQQIATMITGDSAKGNS